MPSPLWFSLLLIPSTKKLFSSERMLLTHFGNAALHRDRASSHQRLSGHHASCELQKQGKVAVI